MKIEVIITQEMIDAGVRGDCGACPVALGLHAAGFPLAEVAWGIVDNLIPGNPDRYFELPDQVNNWIRDFDAFGTGQPFSFELDVDINPEAA